MSGERDELLRLVRNAPEDQVPRLLAVLRPPPPPRESDRPWPPPLFASAPGDGTSAAPEANELPRDWCQR